MKTNSACHGSPKVLLVAILLPWASYSYGHTIGIGTTIERATNYYTNIAIVRVVSGKLLEIGRLPPCEYLYRGVVHREIKGRIGKHEVLFLSRRGFSIGEKYIIFMSDVTFAKAWDGLTSIVDGVRVPYYGDHGKTWHEVCSNHIEKQESKVYLSWLGTSLQYVTPHFETSEEWLTYDPRIIRVFQDVFEFHPESITLSIDNEDGRLIRYRELVSASSLIGYMVSTLTPTDQ